MTIVKYGQAALSITWHTVLPSVETAALFAITALAIGALGATTLTAAPAALLGCALGGANALTDRLLQRVVQTFWGYTVNARRACFIASILKYVLLGVGFTFAGAVLMGSPFTATAALSLLAAATITTLAYQVIKKGAIVLGKTCIGTLLLAGVLLGAKRAYASSTLSAPPYTVDYGSDGSSGDEA